VGAGAQHARDIVRGADAAADRERHEQSLGGAPHDVEQDLALFVCRRDVEQHDLVGAFALVAGRERHGVADVAEIDEARALDRAAGRDVEAGNDASLEHQRPSSRAAARGAGATAGAASPGAPVSVTVIRTAPLVLNTASAGASASRSA